MIRISPEPIHPDMVIGAVAGDEEDGAICHFSGVVRRYSRGRRITHLEYHAYPAMAERKMRQIAEEIAERFGVRRLAMVHRVGALQVGENAVVIAAAAPHRDAAFRACRYAIDRVKEVVPIWKKEFTEEGYSWVEECNVDPSIARAREAAGVNRSRYM
ncbi:MAG: molybdenum cofactor biosynthesis protein MoaE [Nitrospinota bacterium]